MADQVRVRVPATSANLGPGFDSFGLALGRYDDVTVSTADAGITIEVVGEGADDVPGDESHLVVSSLLAASRTWGHEPTGLSLHCINGIPHSRGLGSSAAAIVAGVLAARALLPDGSAAPSDDDVFRVAADIEGHPDNVAACLHGGLTVAWRDAEGFRATSLRPHDEVVAVTCIPDVEMSTATARGLLPQTVPHTDAAFSAGRAGLLIAAVTQRPQYLFAATEDLLHQPYRAPQMVPTAELIGALREQGIAAVVSGAGPTALVLSDRPIEDEVRAIAGPDWRVETPSIEHAGARVQSVVPAEQEQDPAATEGGSTPARE